MTDLLVYSIIIPVFPFRLESLGYTGVPEHVGWLLFAYVSHHRLQFSFTHSLWVYRQSAGLVIGTIPIAMFSERYDVRRMPLVIGLVTLLGSQILLMEAPKYWVLCLARVIQGLSSSVVWIVGLALV